MIWLRSWKTRVRFKQDFTSFVVERYHSALAAFGLRFAHGNSALQEIDLLPPQPSFCGANPGVQVEHECGK
jgi:hypothetical protein